MERLIFFFCQITWRIVRQPVAYSERIVIREIESVRRRRYMSDFEDTNEQLQ